MTKTNNKAKKTHQNAKTGISECATKVSPVAGSKKRASRKPVDPAASVRYAMRTECAADCHLLRAILLPWACGWAETQAQLPLDDGTPAYLPDVDVVFSVIQGGPNLGEIRWLFSCIVDCHVAAESVALADEYTGNRIDYDKLEQLMCRPSDDVIKRARDTMKGCYERTRNLETVERLNAEMGDEAAYVKRLRARHAQFWREHLAAPKGKDSPQMEAVAGAYLASAWKDGKPTLREKDIEGILAAAARSS